MAIATKCSTCGYLSKAPETFIGRQTKCKQCGKVFTIRTGLISDSAIDYQPSNAEIKAIRLGGTKTELPVHSKKEQHSKGKTIPFDRITLEKKAQ